MHPTPPAPPPAAPHRTIVDRASWVVVATMTVLLPLVMSRTGRDAFRFPKQLVFETGALLLLALALAGAALGVPIVRRKWPRAVAWLAAGIVLWSVVTTLLSTNRLLSVYSLGTVIASIVVFAATFHSIDRRRPLWIVYLLIVPAAVNAAVALLQRTQIWTPFRTNTDFSHRLRTTAFLGNPNDIGWGMVVPLLAALALGIASRRHRWAAWPVAALLAGAIVASETVGAVLGAAAGVVILLWMTRGRLAALTLIVLMAASPAVVLLSPARAELVKEKIVLAAAGDFDPIASGRMPPFVTAWRMFLDRPLTGVGPGGFGFHYFDYKVALADRYAFMARHPENWGEVHNEHLQFLAEGGVPAYALFLAALFVLGRLTPVKTGSDDDVRHTFVRTLALPLAAAIAVVALTAFPFRIAVTLQQMIFAAGLLIGWGNDR